MILRMLEELRLQAIGAITNAWGNTEPMFVDTIPIPPPERQRWASAQATWADSQPYPTRGA